MPILAADWQMLGSPAADWLTMLAAVAAGVVAYLAFRKTSETNDAQQKTLKLQQKQFEVAEGRDKRAQASKVMFAADDEDNANLRVQVINASDTPIYSILFLARAFEPDSRTVIADLRFVMPTGRATAHLDFPGPPFEFPPDLVEMVFVDADGYPWVRDWRGTLREMDNHFNQYINDAVRGVGVISRQNERIARGLRLS